MFRMSMLKRCRYFIVVTGGDGVVMPCYDGILSIMPILRRTNGMKIWCCFGFLTISRRRRLASRMRLSSCIPGGLPLVSRVGIYHHPSQFHFANRYPKQTIPSEATHRTGVFLESLLRFFLSAWLVWGLVLLSCFIRWMIVEERYVARYIRRD